MTWAPACSSARAHWMLRSSSNRAVSSTSTVTCLLRSAARCSAAMIGEPDAGAIERLLDREHVGVVGRLRDEGDDRVVGVVGVVQQHVAIVEHLEQVGLLVLAEDTGRLQRRLAQRIESRQLGQSEQHAQVERTRARRRPLRARCRADRAAGRSVPPRRRTRPRAGRRRCGGGGGLRAPPPRDGFARPRRRARARHRGRGG